MIRHAMRALLACTFVLAASTAASADDCKLARIASFDFTVGRNGVMVVPVSIEGTNEPMAIDTGSPVSEIGPEVAGGLHLATHRIAQGFMFNSSGEQFTQVATIHNLEIGTMHGSNVEMLVSPSLLTQDGSIAGTLGADMLRQFDIDIDFGARKLNLFSQDHCAGKVVYWPAAAVTVVPVHVVNSGHILVPVTLDGHDFDAMLDTGSTYTHLSQEAARNIFGLAPDSPGMTKIGSFGPGGRTPVYQHVFDSLVLQGIVIRHPAIHIFEDLLRTGIAQTPHLGSRINDVGESGGFSDLILGTHELRNLHVYIAYREQKLYISAAAPPVAAATGAAPIAAH